MRLGMGDMFIARSSEVLTRMEREGAALGHFNVSDLVLVKAVIEAAAETGLPVLVGASEGEREFLVPASLPLW
jgi:fructose/tagatose bisphosphate aldolase